MCPRCILLPDWKLLGPRVKSFLLQQKKSPFSLLAPKVSELQMDKGSLRLDWQDHYFLRNNMVQFCLTNSIFTKSLTSWSSNFIESTGGSFQTFSIKSLLTWWWEVGEAWWQFTKTCQVQTITGWWFPEENTLVKTLGLYNANRHPALRIAHVLNAHFWNIEDQTVITVIKANKKHSYLTWDLTRYSKGMFTYIYI